MNSLGLDEDRAEQYQSVHLRLDVGDDTWTGSWNLIASKRSPSSSEKGEAKSELGIGKAIFEDKRASKQTTRGSCRGEEEEVERGESATHRRPTSSGGELRKHDADATDNDYISFFAVIYLPWMALLRILWWDRCSMAAFGER